MKSILTRIATLSVLLTALIFVVQGTASAHTVPVNHQIVPAAFSQSCPASRSQGSSGALVQVIQFRLNDLNEEGDVNHPFGNPFPLATDGSFGGLTNEAVRDFQSTWGLGVDGIVGNQTWGTLGFCTGASLTFEPCCTSPSTSHAPATIQTGSTGDLVAALQRALNMDAGDVGTIGKGSWFPLTIDGDFGGNTRAAVQSLQAATGITQDGIVGPQTWGKLGMDY